METIASRQIELDRCMLDELIHVRKYTHPDLRTFSEYIGLDYEDVLDFELDPMDHSLHFIRIYACGLGVTINHFVQLKE